MALAEIDRDLLERCLANKPQAWEDFVDRYLGLVVHVVTHTAQSRSLRLSESDREDLISDVFLAILDQDYAVLRRFRGQSSLATYLTVIARRVVVRKIVGALSGSHKPYPVASAAAARHTDTAVDQAPSAEQRIEDVDQVQQLLRRLDGPEAEVVRLFHLEGKSYHEISDATGMTENSIGPALSRARDKMRQAIPPADAPGITPSADQPTG